MITGHNFIVGYFKDQAQGISIKGKKLVIDRVKKGEEMLPPQPQVIFCQRVVFLSRDTKNG